MSKVDWSTAPEGAEFFCGEYFYKADSSGLIKFFRDNEWNDSALQSRLVFMQQHDYEVRPTQWPETDERIDRIGRDRTEDDMGHYNEQREAQSAQKVKPVSAADFLSEGLKILSERGNQYGSNQRECSFPQAAEAFNALTGHKLKGSDICLIVALVKQVRQYAQPRFHEDSAVDAVNYLALQSELLKKERSNEN
jgi:hypothetical protein